MHPGGACLQNTLMQSSHAPYPERRGDKQCGKDEAKKGCQDILLATRALACLPFIPTMILTLPGLLPAPSLLLIAPLPFLGHS